MMRTYTCNGETVTVGGLKQALWQGQRCYRVEGSGSIGAYLGEGTEIAATALHVEEHRNGMWTLWYTFSGIEEHVALPGGEWMV
jgi:hypothetical protein